MLSTIGRAAVRRVVARSPQSTNRAFQSIWHLHHVGASQNPSNTSTRPNVPSSIARSFATATKAAPKTKTTKATTTKPKKTATKKAVKKPTKKKATPKPKPKVRKPVKKVLTEEQKQKVVLKELKAKALSPPKKKPQNAWTVLASQYAKENGPNMSSGGMKEAAAKYKSLSPEQLESYNHIANQNKAANEIALKQWIESHTPEQIRVANNARLQLKRKDPGHTWTAIQDARIPKRPRQAMSFFVKERHASGDLKGIGLAENGRLVAKEWTSLSPSERKTYEDLAIADKQRYAQEFKTVFHRDPELVRSAKAA